MAKPKRTILVIEDSPIMQGLLEKYLKNDNYLVVPAFGAVEGLEKARTTHPDAILLDVILPDGDGKDVARQLGLMEETKEIPIVFATNTIHLKDDKGDEVFEIDGKAFRAFAKPVHPQKLLSVIRKEINRRMHKLT